MLIQALHEIQDRHGYLPAQELRALSARLRTPLYRLHELASFFPHFRLAPPPKVDVCICRDMACHVRGAPGLHQGAQTLARHDICVSGVSCLGQCDGAPAVSVNDHIYRAPSDEELRHYVETAVAGGPLPRARAERSPPSWHIDPYGGKTDYEAIRQLLAGGDRDGILRELEVANLRGMGGAGFPAFRKWAAVRQATADQKYVICNADESEPGTFKDRELLRRLPQLVIEGMLLAGFVSGATRGYIYVRHEFHDEIEALGEALATARTQQLCGGNILGSGWSFPIEIFVSPGGYICGEETALLEAMEDRRAEPRNKPPFPVEHGLYSKPTVINNVETLCWTPAIALRGGAWYRDQGVNGAQGLRLVSVSGDVNRPGVYEVPLGQTVRELLACAGGVRDGRKLQAIATSGPSSGFLPAQIPVSILPAKFVQQWVPPGNATFDILDLPLDWATLAQLGSMLGAAFFVVADGTDIVDLAINCTEFFRNESCGKCVPCRIGSQHLVEIGTRLRSAKLSDEQRHTISELAEAMQLTSICGLGQVAANPLTTVLKYLAGGGGT